MVKLTINGKRYGLRFDLDALDQIEEEFGSYKEMFELLQSGRQQTKIVKKLLLIMANAQRGYEGLPEDLDERILRHAPISVIAEMKAAVKSAMDEGMHTETMNGGEADDDVHDGYLDEIEQEEKKD